MILLCLVKNKVSLTVIVKLYKIITCCLHFSVKIWKKMLEKEYNHTLLDFEVQLQSMHLDNECTENTDDEES